MKAAESSTVDGSDRLAARALGNVQNPNPVQKFGVRQRTEKRAQAFRRSRQKRSCKNSSSAVPTEMKLLAALARAVGDRIPLLQIAPVGLTAGASIGQSPHVGVEVTPKLWAAI